MAKCGHLIIHASCPVCREIQKKWYRKLEDAKFEDAESMRYGDDRPLKAWHSYAFQRIAPIEFEITHDYYEKALELLHNYEFSSLVQQRIWELHCAGMSRHKIEDAVKHFKDAPKQSTIRKIIMDLEREITW